MHSHNIWRELNASDNLSLIHAGVVVWTPFRIIKGGRMYEARPSQATVS